MKKVLIVLAVLTLAVPLALMAGSDDPVEQQKGAVQTPCPKMEAGMQKGCGGHNMGRGMGKGMEMGGCFRQGDDDERGPECMLEMAKELGLTEQQITQIKKLRHDFQLQQIDRRAELDKAELAMRELRGNDKSAESEVLAQIDKLGQLRTQQEKAMYSHRRAIQSVLTEEQRTKLQTLRAEGSEDDDEGMPGMSAGCMGGQGKGHKCSGRCGK
jgi:protein CpxP